MNIVLFSGRPQRETARRLRARGCRGHNCHRPGRRGRQPAPAPREANGRRHTSRSRRSRTVSDRSCPHLHMSYLLGPFSIATPLVGGLRPRARCSRETPTRSIFKSHNTKSPCLAVHETCEF